MNFRSSRFPILAAAISLAFNALPASALQMGKPKAIVNGSLGIPASPEAFSKGSSLGFGGGIGLAMYVSPMVMLMATVDYTTFGADESGLRQVYDRPNASVLGGETSILYAAVTARVDLLQFSVFRPFVTGGAGFYRVIPDDIQFDNSIVDRSLENAPGVHFGVGLDASLGTLINVFADIGYVTGFTSNDTMSYWPMRGGLMFALSPDDQAADAAAGH